jgi:DNA-binding beta-propeller fold protein YncE
MHSSTHRCQLRFAISVFWIVLLALLHAPAAFAERTSEIIPFADAPFPAVSTLAKSTSAHDVLKNPRGLCVDRRTGDVYVADTGHHQIRRVRVNGTVDVIAGTGTPGAKDGPAGQAQFKEPQAVLYDVIRQILYVADTGNNAIRSLSAV